MLCTYVHRLYTDHYLFDIMLTPYQFSAFLLLSHMRFMFKIHSHLKIEVIPYLQSYRIQVHTTHYHYTKIVLPWPFSRHLASRRKKFWLHATIFRDMVNRTFFVWLLNHSLHFHLWNFILLSLVHLGVSSWQDKVKFLLRCKLQPTLVELYPLESLKKHHRSKECSFHHMLHLN